jgi:RNA polymerase sigma factor (TIGR02999 family)
MAELTVLIRRAADGDQQARAAVFRLIYGELCKLARAQLSRGGRDAQLDTVALVNEAYLRLEKAQHLKPDDRSRYFAYVGRVMRSVIVDCVRARAAQRRGGGTAHLTLTTGIADAATSGETQVVRVHEALQELAAVDPRIVQVVEMRYFAGLSEREIASALGVAERTVRRDWEKARLLLSLALK